MNLFVVEMRRALHRRLVRWMIAIALAFTALMGTIAMLTHARTDGGGDGDGHPSILVDWYDRSSGDGVIFIGGICLLIGAAICGASVAGAEWRAGTMTTHLTWSPARVRLHLARTASAAVLSFLIGLALLVTFMAAAVPSMLAHGSTGGTDAQWWTDLALVVLRLAGMASLIAVLALSIATLGRNTAAALIALAAWSLFVENLVRGLKPGLSRWLIGENAAIVVPWKPMEDAPFSRPPIVALATLVLYVGSAVLVASWSFRNRDVAAT